MKKRLGVLFLLVILFGGSAFAFAWWDNLTDDSNNVTITVGQGVTLNVNLDEQSAEGNLVPSGVVLKSGDVTQIVITYDVNLDVEVLEALNLSVTASNILIGGSDINSSLVNVSIDAPETINNTVQTVTITVTLNTPTSQAQYDAIKNGTITFDLTFTAQQ